MSYKILDMIHYDKISEYGKTVYDYLFAKKDDKQILDPLTTVIKIALLYFYETGTKVSINNNCIQFHEPTPFQGVVRFRNGDSRTKLHNLKEPIQNCMLWFPYSRYEDLKKIYKYAVKGLQKLKVSYNNSTNDLIDYYIEIINKNLNEMENKLDSSKLEETIVLQDRLQSDIKKIWNYQEVKLIRTFFDILEVRYENKDIKNVENEDGKGVKNVLKSIFYFLKEKDEKVVKYLNEFITHL